MTKTLTREDWERIAHALSNFRHHPDYHETLRKVCSLLDHGE